MARLRRHERHGLGVAAIGLTTVWRWLREDALRPWTPRSWLFPRGTLACLPCGGGGGEAVACHRTGDAMEMVEAGPMQQALRCA